MACEISATLLTESLAGDIGEDWEYNVVAEAFNPDLTGSATIVVPEHSLRPGATQPPPGPPPPARFAAGRCSSVARVRLNVNAAEVDYYFDDEGTDFKDFRIPCPVGENRRLLSTSRCRSECANRRLCRPSLRP